MFFRSTTARRAPGAPRAHAASLAAAILRRSAINLALVLLAPLLAVPPAPADTFVVPGRGPARSDCLAAWGIDLAAEPSDTDIRRARIRCADGTPTCDADATADGTCTFRVSICFGVTTAVPTCESGTAVTYTLMRPSARAARRNGVAARNRAAILDAIALVDVPLAAGACTPEASISVPLRKGGRARTVTLRGRASRTAAKGGDRDVLRLRCTQAKEPGAAHRLGVVLTSDFENTGSYSTITLDVPRTVRRDLGETHADAFGRVFAGRVYVVNRLGQDNIQTVNPHTGRSLSACSIANGSNPQDIVFIGKDKAYVSRLRDGIVSIVDPTVSRRCAGFKRGRIDLTRFADGDASPELGRMVLVGDRAYVSVLRLDRNRRFVPAARGLVAVIDTTTDTLVDTDPATPAIDAIPLAGENPFGMVFDPVTARIWVWETGGFFVPNDGGIEAIDPNTNRAGGFFATESDLGGTITVVAPYTAERAFAVVADDHFRNKLIAFSPRTGKALGTLYQSADFLPDIAVNDRGELWLADRTPNTPGVRIFDAESGTALAGPIDVGLPPARLLFAP